MPCHAVGLPSLEPVHVRAWRDEELHLHLLEFARSENEVTWRDLVTKRLSDLRDPERNLLARRLLHVQEVDVDALCRLRSQVDDGCALLDRAHERLEHQVEHARRSQGAVRSLARTFAGLLR